MGHHENERHDYTKENPKMMNMQKGQLDPHNHFALTYELNNAPTLHIFALLRED